MFINVNNLFKVDITEFETEVKKAADNSNYATIVSYDESLNFLEKYGFKVINLVDNNKTKQTNVDLAKKLYAEDKLSYIFVIENEKINEEISSLIKEYDVEQLTVNSLENISEDAMENNDDFLSLMHYNLDLIKKETYK